MQVDQDQPAPAPQRHGRTPHPGVQVPDPAQHPVRGHHQVEPAREGVGQRLRVRLDELRLRRQPGPRRELPGPADGHGGEVHPGHPGPEPCPAEGVHAEVALKVQQVQPPHLPGQLPLQGEQRLPAREEPLDVVEPVPGRRPVHPRPLVPHGPVHRARRAQPTVTHRASLSGAPRGCDRVSGRWGPWGRWGCASAPSAYGRTCSTDRVRHLLNAASPTRAMTATTIRTRVTLHVAATNPP